MNQHRNRKCTRVYVVSERRLDLHSREQVLISVIVGVRRWSSRSALLSFMIFEASQRPESKKMAHLFKFQLLIDFLHLFYYYFRKSFYFWNNKVIPAVSHYNFSENDQL